LVFDKAQLSDKIRAAAQAKDAEVYEGVVSYKNRQLPVIGDQRLDVLTVHLDFAAKAGLEHYARAHFDANLEEIFLQKNEDWAGEREYRWLICKNDTDFFMCRSVKPLSVSLWEQSFRSASEPALATMLFNTPQRLPTCNGRMASRNLCQCCLRCFSHPWPDLRHPQRAAYKLASQHRGNNVCRARPDAPRRSPLSKGANSSR
jgi:hypothetical protein